ncbi:MULTISPECIES: DM13 domain-containing protein [Nocardia]|uniref:Electron transfer DM13 n=2 Tax=Nocardia TaxID=1817 RepID=A0A4R6PTL0_NOCIG|nr:MULTISPECIES: DM13 domain-containing protein [Nocardia]NKX88118.1 DM13 domain-containing protein [Nocardia coubleae]TDP41984.1 electron transfer DM13 [Nocardia ignorata]
MSARRVLFSVLTIGLVAAVAVGLYLFQPWRLFTTVTVDEAPVVAADGAPPPLLAQGTFLSHEHDTSGTVVLQRAADGTVVVRITDLRTSDGPALRVWLTDQPVIPDDWHNFDDGTHIDLGALKGNEGNQNYEVPAGTDLSSVRSVSIWCERFHVSFGAATLTPV